MKKYRAKVNGTEYEIEIEVVKDHSLSHITHPSLPPQAQDKKAQSAPASNPDLSVAGAGAAEKINSPMSGTILEIQVKAGDMAERGQVLMVLEAMKMENEIVAPRTAKVKSVAVTQGMSVEAGTVLCEIQ